MSDKKITQYIVNIVTACWWIFFVTKMLSDCFWNKKKKIMKLSLYCNNNKLVAMCVTKDDVSGTL